MEMMNERVGSAARRARQVVVVARGQLLREAMTVAYRGEGYAVQTSTHEAVVDLLLREQSIDLVVVNQSSTVEDDWPTIKRIRDMSDVAVVALAETASLAESAQRTAHGRRRHARPADEPGRALGTHRRRAAALRGARAGADRGRRHRGETVTQHTVTRASNAVPLTVMEFDLLRTLCRHPRTVLSKAQLLQTVWGFDHYDHNVVEVHMSALRRKLEQHGPRAHPHHPRRRLRAHGPSGHSTPSPSQPFAYRPVS